MKYLGVLLDNKWTFKSHFHSVVTHAERMIRKLRRILPNMRGPDERVRRLYVEVVHSILLYEAPLWASALTKLRPAGNSIRCIQRQLATRLI